MVKKIIVALLCVALCGCASSNDINTKLDKIFEDNSSTNYSSNNYCKYLEYFLPTDVYEISSNETEFVFETANSTLIMNVNIPSIINSRFYMDQVLTDDGFFDENKKIYETKGDFVNPANETTSYFFKEYEIDNMCLLHLATNELNFYGYSSISDSPYLASKMFEMAKSCEVSKKDIVADFSNKNVIDYTRKSVDLFKTYFPESGRVDDLIIEESLVD